MEKFKYKTKNNSTPNGKPKVYFCYHQSDLNYQLERVSLELFKYLNINIIYLESPNDDMKNNFEMISTCKLVILPIICDVFNFDDIEYKELKYAMEQNIPILPLLVIENMEKVYSEKIGDIQYIKFTEALSYEKDLQMKVKKQLISIFTDDETINKIYDAFSGYIFLSYRKKDKNYVKQLMKLIHNIPECQNIAIWYDEFLTPGENFNEQIENMILDSDFFVLAVTPNLVNEINYVMTKEYPLAYENEKDIIPIELVETNRLDLENYYLNIDPCIPSKENEIQIAFSQKEKIKTINKELVTVERQYLIGIAYLEGINVEVNKLLAKELIEKAAEAEYEPAMKRLVRIYQYGDGIVKDINRAFYWLRKLINHIKKDDNLEETRLWDLLETRIDLFELQRSEAIKTDESFLDIVDDAIKWLSNSTKMYSLYYLVEILHKSIFCINSDFVLNDFHNYRYEALKIVEQVLDKKPDDRYFLELYAKCYYIIGAIEEERTLKKENFLKSINILENIEQDEYNEIYYWLGNSYLNMSKIFLKEGKIKKAINYFLKAEEYVLLDGDDYEICSLYNDFASNLYFKDEYEFALEYLTKSQAKLFAIQSDSQKYLNLRKDIYMNYHNVYFKMGQYDLSFEYENKTANIFKELYSQNQRLYGDEYREFLEDRISYYEEIENYERVIVYKLLLLNLDVKKYITTDVSLMLDLISIYLKTNDIKKAKQWLHKSELELNKKWNLSLKYSEINSLKYHEMKKDFFSAKICILEGNIEIAVKLLMKCLVFSLKFSDEMEHIKDINIIDELLKILKYQNKIHVMNMLKYIFCLPYEFSFEYSLHNYCNIMSDFQDENTKIHKYGLKPVIRFLISNLNELQENMKDNNNDNDSIIWDISSYMLAIGFCYDKTGDIKKAYAYYKQSFLIEEPNLLEYENLYNYCKLGELCEKIFDNINAQNNYDKAEIIAKNYFDNYQEKNKGKTFNSLIYQRKLYIDTLLKKGEFLEKINIEMALKTYFRAYELMVQNYENLNEEYTFCLLRIGNCYLKIEKYDKTIYFLEKLVDISNIYSDEKIKAYYLLLNAYIAINNKEKVEYIYSKFKNHIEFRFKLQKFVRGSITLEISEYKTRLKIIKIWCDIFYAISEKYVDFMDDVLLNHLKQLKFFNNESYQEMRLYKLYCESFLLNTKPSRDKLEILFSLYRDLMIYYYKFRDEKLYKDIIIKLIWLLAEYRLMIEEKIELSVDTKSFLAELYLSATYFCDDKLYDEYLNESYTIFCQLYEESQNDEYLFKIKKIEKLLHN